MMKITYLCVGVNANGGTERVHIQKANYLALHGYDVTILVLGEKPDEKPFFTIEERVKVVYFSLNYSSNHVTRNPLRFIYEKLKQVQSYKRAVSNYLKENSCDIFISLVNYGFIPRLKDGSKKLHEVHMSQESINVASQEFGFSRLMDLAFKYRNWLANRSIKHYDKFIVLTELDKKLRGNPHNCVAIPNSVTITPPKEAATLENKQVVSLVWLIRKVMII